MYMTKGLTIVEVLVALVILLVGVFGLIGFQTFAISASADARIINELTRVARGELASQRQIAGTAPSEACRVSSSLEEPYGCMVTRLDCVTPAAGGSYQLTCGLIVSNPTGRFVTVDVTGPRGRALSLSTLVTGRYFTGDAGQVLP